MADTAVVRQITIRGRTEGIDQATSSLRGMSDAQRSVIQATDQLRQSVDRASASLNTNVQNLNQLKSANDNVSSSYMDMERSKGEFDKGLVQSIADTLNLINHLKLLALAGYAMVPAFRGFVNAEIQRDARLLGTQFSSMLPALEAIGQRALPLVTNGLSFFARISIPIGAAVLAWKALNSIIDQGAGLLDKYANAGRQLYGGGVDAALEKLTKFQNDSISAIQIQRATELGARLQQAKFMLDQFFKVQFDTTDMALRLQSIWVRIVEAISHGVTVIANLKTTTEGAAASFGNSPFWQKVLSLGTTGGLGSLPGTITPGPGGVIPGTAPVSLDDLRAAGRRQLSGALIQGYNQPGTIPIPYGKNEATQKQLDDLEKAREDFAAKTGFPGRFTGNLAGLGTKPEAAAEDAYDRFERNMENRIKQLQEEADGASKTSAAIEELKVQHEGENAAASAGIPVTEKMRAQWKAWGDEIAKLNIQMRQAEALQEERFKGATQFMSPADQAAANIARKIDPMDWQSHMGDAAAQLARFNSTLTQSRDLATTFSDTMVSGFMAGQKASEVLNTALKSLETTLLQMLARGAINALFSVISGGGGGILPGGAPAGQGGIGHAAMGQAFSNGRIVPFAYGGVVSSPTLFPMRGGAGLMGEAGPEAVMPLSRDASGRLGVRGGGTNVNVIVNNKSGADVDVQHNKKSNGDVDIVATVKEIVNKHVATGGMDGPMRARFGQQIRARPR